jgi:hypothetical protein
MCVLLDFFFLTHWLIWAIGLELAASSGELPAKQSLGKQLAYPLRQPILSPLWGDSTPTVKTPATEDKTPAPEIPAPATSAGPLALASAITSLGEFQMTVFTVQLFSFRPDRESSPWLHRKASCERCDWWNESCVVIVAKYNNTFACHLMPHHPPPP